MFFLVKKVYQIFLFLDMTSDLPLFSFGEVIPNSTTRKYQSIFHAVLGGFVKQQDFFFFFLFLEELAEGVSHV